MLSKCIKILPNCLSIFRILVAPLFVHGLSANHWYSFVILLLGTFSDFLDGYFARKFNVISKLGMLLDPLADKIFSNTVLWSLYIHTPYRSLSMLFMVLTLTLRDLVLFFGSSFILLKKLNINITPIYLSKICTTIIFMFSICILLFPNNELLVLYGSSICIFLIVTTTVIYCYRFLTNK